jgi:hypothetical protein
MAASGALDPEGDIETRIKQLRAPKNEQRAWAITFDVPRHLVASRRKKG